MHPSGKSIIRATAWCPSFAGCRGRSLPTRSTASYVPLRDTHRSNRCWSASPNGVRARNQARLTYSVYLGFLQLQRQHQTPHLSSEEFEDYIEHVISTLIPD
jgi:hypothetical protein